MIWTVMDIQDEEDVIFEEEMTEPKMPGEPDLFFVTLSGEDGRICRFAVAKDWLKGQEIELGDEWPEDLDEADAEDIRSHRQAEWMDGYYDALEEAGINESEN